MNITENSKLSVGLAITVIAFVIYAILHIQSVETRLLENQQKLRQELLIEIEKRFVLIQDFAVQRTILENIQSNQRATADDIKEIKGQLEQIKRRR